MPTSDRLAGYKLIHTATLVEFEVVETKVQPSPDGESSHVQVEIQFGGPEDGEGDEQVEWGALGFIFALASLSFEDARPRGNSEPAFVAKDEFTVADLLDGLRFVRGELHFDADYLRGRCVKTAIVARSDGRVTLETRGRGDGAVRWVERMRGRKKMELVP